jgi:2-keto-4-pentenoate hydratase/2-oxohepta-3-ene-1,7-dioic acid hydratase in catechol pathway
MAGGERWQQRAELAILAGGARIRYGEISEPLLRFQASASRAPSSAGIAILARVMDAPTRQATALAANMRLATLKTKFDSRPLVAVGATDGTWREIAATDLAALLADARELARVTAASGRHWREDEFEFLPPVPRPPSLRDFYAFEQHVKASRVKRGLEMVPAWYEVPAFYFSNHNSLVGHDAAVHAPAGCAELDFELELGIVIGPGGRDISIARAWEHVAGFTVLNDFSARDVQRKEMTIGLGPSKGKDFATGLGPWLVTREEFADRIEGERLTLEMSARLNGREISRGNVASIHHSIPKLVAHASRDAMLFPGDVLGTGTVGTGCIWELGPEKTGGWLKPSDVIELEIERIGTLRNRIVAREG